MTDHYERIREAFDEISGLCRHLRQGGPAPEDLQDLSDALDEAVGIAANMLHDLAQQPPVHHAITHCDNCGCDWLDNGLNPVGCPYCKQNELRGALECMIIGACAVAVPHNGERAVLQDAVNIARAALAAQQQETKT